MNPNFPGYRLVFDDEFEGTALDESNWYVAEGPFLGGVLSRDSVTVSQGFAKFVTYTEDGVHHSGYITTATAEFGYGYFEARVWLSGMAGQGCAFFTYPDTFGQYPGDPAAAGIELDIFEHGFVNDNGPNPWDNVYVGAHWYGAGPTLGTSGALLPLPDGDRIQGEWRTFGVLWEPTGYTFYAADKPLWTPDAPLSGRPARVKLVCQVRGGGWAGPIPEGGFGSRATSTAGMAIDWVRIWQPPE